ncbi:hypothetical protein Z968_01380 [Clostridium novyi A str. 4552]|uniref:DUF4380 domain-containing protein n=1 Tax=Clostridium novyi A str. 4552 TaxID=1444289 RepID=A0A0A0IBU0_CLONO|nr:hypothetical protein [Clostridium novyi]KGM98003.1 hypothetical protein Z968_01380 [Clostridium novyi A str. 4552]
MGKVKIEEIAYKKWGNCLKINNGLIEVVATLDFGPRIIRFCNIEKDNMFFEDETFKIANNGQQFSIFDSDEGWKIYGGHRLWVSPESDPRTYYPDNKKVEWNNMENGVLLKAQKEKWTNIQKEIELRLDEDKAEVTLVHKITNLGPWSIKCAPWALTVMAPGGKEVIPQSSRKTGLLPNRQLVLWPYSKLNDKRLYLGEKYITLKQNKDNEQQFKIGINNELGWIAYFNYNNLFIKKYNHLIDGMYPDFGVSYETYTNNLMLEMETLGQLQDIEPYKAIEHKEQWYLFEDVVVPDDNDFEIEKVIKPYIDSIR